MTPPGSQAAPANTDSAIAPERDPNLCGWSWNETFMPRNEHGDHRTCGGCGSTILVTALPGRDGVIPGHNTDGIPRSAQTVSTYTR